ncbi:MAG TPA: hypothetical protein VN969_24590 [Streptosporangiaceae bacterium]|jgi:hypothetical protein|nr:hypothetical protein [Streptosporangiaceae bacterium]
MAAADVTITKAETAAGDRTWLMVADGTVQRVAVHVVHDLPHLVVESLFGLDDGLWGVLARGGFATANRAASARDSRRARLVTDVELDELAARNWAGHRVAKAATNAVTNRWQDGPDTPGGAANLRERDKRASLPADEDAREHLRRMGELADRLGDDAIQLAINEVQRLAGAWRALAPGESLRLQWPCSVPTPAAIHTPPSKATAVSVG